MILPKIVGVEESLGRYLPQDSYFSGTKNAVKPKAFMPPKDLKLSVFGIDGLNLEDVWGIGQKHVIDNMPKPKILYGIADIKVFKVQEKELSVDPDNNPVRHANIVGWPVNIARRQSIAQELAAESTLILKE